MSNRPAFDPKELEVVGTHTSGPVVAMKAGGLLPPEAPDFDVLYNWPITPKENFKLACSGEKPYWIPHSGMAYSEVCNFRPRIFADNVATHLAFDAEPPIEYETDTMRGWFGLDWVYVPVAGGATVKPGAPLIEDMNDWEEKIVWPDLDELDWEGLGRKNKEHLNTPQLNQLGMLDGFWERLISLMDVSGAAMALIDEDQKEAVHAFFDKYADFMIDCIRRVKAVCDIDSVLIHDDWGTQNGPFFSLETAREMFVPYLKRITDYLHSEGMSYEQHSCGNCSKLVPAYIEAGVDFWNPQPINDFEEITKLAEGTCLHIAMPDVPLAPDATEEEIRQAARDFFDHFGVRGVFYAPSLPNPIFLEELYKYSREYYAK